MQTLPANFDSRIIIPSIPAGVVLTQAQRDATADRIAAFLRERKKIAEQRRLQECEYRTRNSERARERYYRMVRSKLPADTLTIHPVVASQFESSSDQSGIC